jgi:hypothetical protein
MLINKVDHSLIKKSTCSEKQNQKLLTKISQLEGKIPSYVLSVDMTIEPRTIVIDKLHTILKRVTPSELHQLEVAQFKNYTANQKVSWQVTCEQCANRLGSHSIKLRSSQKELWLSSKLRKRIVAFKANSHIKSMNKELGSHLFSKEEFLTDKPELYLSNLDNLHFYQTNKTLQQNRFLKQSDPHCKVIGKTGTTSRSYCCRRINSVKNEWQGHEAWSLR